MVAYAVKVLFSIYVIVVDCIENWHNNVVLGSI